MSDSFFIAILFAIYLLLVGMALSAFVVLWRRMRKLERYIHALRAEIAESEYGYEKRFARGEAVSKEMRSDLSHARKNIERLFTRLDRL